MRVIHLVGLLIFAGCTTVEVQAAPTSTPAPGEPPPAPVVTSVQTTTLASTTAAPTTSAPIESADPNDRLISDSEWKVIVELSAADAEASVERAVPFIGGFCDFVGQLGLQETKRRFESTFDENDVPQVGRDLTYNGATYYCLEGGRAEDPGSNQRSPW